MKKAFTLIELMIAITIFAIILTYLYQSLNIAKVKNKNSEERLEKHIKEEKIKYIIYNDIFNQTKLGEDLNITNIDKQLDILRLRTNNSIHNLISPNVAYFVVEKNLFRIESREKIELPVTYENMKNYEIDEALNEVELFRVYKNKNSLLFFLKFGKKEKTFEIDLPFSAKQIDKNTSEDNNTDVNSSMNPTDNNLSE